MSKLDKSYHMVTNILALASGVYVGSLTGKELKRMDTIIIILLIANIYLSGIKIGELKKRK